MAPKSKEIGFKVILELVSLTVLGIPMIYVHLIAGSNYQPKNRGFFCDDQNLKHPYVENETVPMVTCFIIWAALVTFFVFFIEFLRYFSYKQEDLQMYGLKLPWILIELYRHIGYMIVGAMSCFLFTDLSKFRIGRLRPHFLSICKPNYTALCKDKYDYYRYVTENDSEICTGLAGNTTAKMLKEARLSFMSGHSSFSFYCATFLVLYLQARLNKWPEQKAGPLNVLRQALKVLRPFFQFGLLTLAFWIALTRISDYFHHPLDVTMGSAVGIIFAITTVSVADIFKKPSAFWHSIGETLLEKKRIDSQDSANNSNRKTFEDYLK